jgi:ubiquinone/menaquinone biosynthesis C-methylase UbiE
MEIMNLISIIQMLFNAVAKPRQHIVIQEVPKGRVIDIGGGGEGVIAQAGGVSVFPIDKYKSEILEARGNAPDVSWMVADATALPCQSECFDNATAFFSCMYMSNDIKEKVFRETLRVLKPGGEFWVWDTPISTRSKTFAIRLRVDFHEMPTINTVFGVKTKDQNATSICRLLEKAKFTPEIITDRKHWFLIKARRA